MPTTDKAKNLEYVKKSQAKKKQTIGTIEYNKINSDTEQKHRDKLKKTIGEAEYKKEQAEYMRQYRARQKQLKNLVETKQKSINTLTNAIKARKARQELLSLAVARANKTADKLTEIQQNARDLIKTGKSYKR